jgi:hypothetical protein
MSPTLPTLPTRATARRDDDERDTLIFFSHAMTSNDRACRHYRATLLRICNILPRLLHNFLPPGSALSWRHRMARQLFSLFWSCEGSFVLVWLFFSSRNEPRSSINKVGKTSSLANDSKLSGIFEALPLGVSEKSHRRSFQRRGQQRFQSVNWLCFFLCAFASDGPTDRMETVLSTLDYGLLLFCSWVGDS